MKFYEVKKNNAPANHFAVYMETTEHQEHYVCDYIAENTPEANAVNELGLTLRARLLRSKGEYAMLEGTIFNPHRLLDIIVRLQSFDAESFSGKEYGDGYTLLKVEADGCLNRYMIYKAKTTDSLLSKLKTMKNS